MANEGNVIGTVSHVQGQVFARGADGKQRPLKVGDPVIEGEVIVTGENGRVELAFNDGQMFVVRNNETVTLDAAVIGNELPDAKDAALLGGVADTNDITRAIAEGGSLDQLLEETAAGNTGAGTGDNGHSFVQLMRIGEELTPADYGWGSRGGKSLDRILPGEPDDTGVGNTPSSTTTTTSGTVTGGTTLPPTDTTVNTTTLSLTASPAVAEGGNITYTASLSNPAGTALTVNLSNGQSIVIAAGSSSASISVAAPTDDVYLDAGSVTASITGTSGGNFESLVNGSISATTAISDTLDTTTLDLSATPSVSEGGSIVYTASLNQPAGSAMTVTLSNGAVISIAAGASTGTVTVAAPAEDAVVDAGNVSVTVSGTSGGNFETLQVGAGSTAVPVVTTITDTIDTTTLSLTASPAVAEGGNITYTASLSNPAGTALTVNLSNGQSITIAAGSSSASISVAAPTDDVYVDAGSVTASITGTSGGNFESLVNGSISATTAISDTLDTTTLDLSATPSVSEGGSIVYTASLNQPAGSAMTVTLSNGAVISIAAGASTGAVSVAAPAEDAVVDAGTVSVTVASTTGGNFETLQVGAGSTAVPVVTTITDTIDTTTLSLTASPAVAEGGNITYTASLSNPAGTALTVTLSNGSSIVIAAGSSSASISVAAPTDDVYVDAGSVTASITGTSGGNFESLVNGSISATTAISDTLDTTTLDLSATPSVSEGGSIVYTASLNQPAGSAMTVTLSNGAVISIAAGASTGAVSVAAPAEDAVVDAGTVSVTVASTTGGNFETLQVGAGSTAVPVVTTITDTIDTTTLSLTASPAVAEGGNITYTASLSNPAGTALTVTLSNGSSIVIAAGASSGSVSVAAPTDDVYVDAGSVTASITGTSGGNFESLVNGSISATTAISDTLDTTTLDLSATPSVSEGGSIVYTASLNQPAGSAMTVTLSNGAVISIAAGASTGTVTVAAPAEDAVVDAGNVSVTVSGTSGGNFETLQVGAGSTAVPVVTTITDTIDTTTLSLTASPAVAEGGNITYTASLSNPAGTALTVNLSNGQSIVIAAGSSSASISVAAPTDDVYVDAGSVTASITGTSGGNFESLVNGSVSATTAISDTLDTTTVSLTGATSVAEGGTATYTVSLTNPAHSDVTVTLNYSGTAANGSDFSGTTTVTIPSGSSSANFSIAAIDDILAEGTESFTVTLASATGGEFENLVLAATGSGGDITTTLTDNDTATVSLSATPSLTEAGGTLVYTATITQAPVSDLTVTLSNGATVTILAGQTSGTVNVPLAASDDVYVDASSLSATITGTMGGGILVAIDPSAATTAIADTTDTTTLSLTASPAVAEGGNITYTASLSNPAGTALTVTLSNGSSITIAAGASSGSVSVAAPTDDVYVDAGSVTASITGTSGGNFESLVNGSVSATTAISDTLDTTTLDLSATPSVAEGGSIVYTASLNQPAGSAMTVTLSNGAVITIAAGASTGSVSVAAPSEDAVVDAGNVSVTVSGTTGGNFETLQVGAGSTATPVVTAITDTTDTTTLSLTASPAVAEGGNITYTASLSNPAGTALTVNLSNGQSITIAAGSSSASISVAAPTDDVYVDAGSVTASITGTSGGNFESLVNGSISATTAISDTLDTTTLDLSATPSVSEGGSIVYTASLNQPAGSAMTVTLSNGAVISIAAGASTGAVSVAAPAEDAVVDAGTVSVTVASTTGGNFETLQVGAGSTATPVVTTITDTTDTTTLSLTASPAVAEGGNITYTASLSNPAGTALTVTLSNGSSIVIAAGSSSASISVAAPTDDVYVDAGSVTASITGTSGGNFESLVNGTVSATTAISDTLDTTTLDLSATPSVSEGGSIVYTASLNQPAGSAMTVTLSNGAVISIAAGASTGTVTVAAPAEDAVVDAGNVSVTVSATSGGNFETLQVGAGSTAVPVVTTITDTIDTTTLSLTASPAVAEGGNITYTASLSNPAGTALTVNLSNGQSIVIAAGSSSASISVAAPTDDVYLDAGSVTASITGTSGGNFESLVNGSVSATTAISDTLDTTTVSLTGATSVAEGGTATYTVSLTNPAQSNVTVTLNYSGTAANGSDFSGTTTVTIPSGSSSANFSLAAIDDLLAEGTESFTVTLASATGGAFENLLLAGTGSGGDITTTLTDNDTATVSLSATPTLTEAGGTLVYTATITQAPVSDLTVTLSNGATVTILAGQTSGTVNVPLAASDDVYVDASSISATITGTTGGGILVAIDPSSATTAIADTTDTTTLNLTASPAVAEGGNITYTASLSNPAGTALTVNLSNGQSIVIAAGSSSASISVAAPTDDVYLDAGSVTTSITGTSGGNFESLVNGTVSATTAISDTLDTTTLDLSATPSVSEGGSIVYTASLNQPAGSAMTVTLSNGAVISIAAGASTGSVSVAAPGEDAVVDAGTVSVTVSATSGGNFETLQVGAGSTATPVVTTITDTTDTTTLSLTASPAVAEGGNITYTASLSNPAGTALTVTLSNGSSITIAAGASSGSISVAAPTDDVYLDAGSVTASITGTSGGNFESLVNGSVSATTAISDTLDTTTVSLTGATSVAEGGTATYTVSLTNPAHSDVTVTLNYSGTAANGSDFSGTTTVTIPSGSSSANFSIAAIDDILAEGTESFTVTLASATGGEFENLVLAATGSGGDITTTLTDNDTATVSLSATPSLTEAGGTLVYTATITQAPVSDLTVTLSNGATVTILAGQTSGTVNVPLAASDDVYVDASSISATITGTTGGGILVAIDPSSATTAIADTTDTTTLNLTASPAVAEGGNITYTASLSNPAGTALTVNLSNGQSIVIAAGSSSASISVAAPTDDVYLDAGSVTASITGTSGGNFESLVNGSVSATTAISDTLDTTTLDLSATPSVSEGGSIVYTASLNQPAGSAMTVTLSNGAVISIAAGASTGSVSVAAPGEDAVVDAGTVSVTVSATSGGNFETLQVGAGSTATPVVTTITDTIDTTTLSLTASPAVAEGGNITYTASLSNPAGTALTVTLSNGSSIVIAAGSSSASISVAAPTDDVYVDAGSVTASITGTSGGNFESLVNGSISATTAISDTLDTTTLDLSATPSVSEGGSIVYTASLNQPAGSAMTVTLSNGAVISIAAGASTGTVTVAAPAEDAVVDAGNVSVTVSGTSGGNFETLQVGAGSTATPVVTTITDTIDTTTLSLTASPAVAEGGNITYTASLSNPAGTALTVTLSNGSSIVIAAGSSSASISVAAPTDDVYVDAGSVTASITGTSGGNFESLVNGTVSATTAISDTLDTTTLDLSATPSVAEGGSIVYTASLNQPAGSAMTVTLSNGAVISIAAGASTGSVSVAAPAEDAVVDAGNVSVTVSATSGGNFETLQVGAGSTATPVVTTITDTTDTTTLSLTASPAVAEGGNITYTASLSNPAGTALTVTLSNGSSIVIAAGSSSASISVAAPTDDVYLDAGSVTTSITGTSGGNFESLVNGSISATTAISDTLDTTTLDLSATPSVAEGGSIVYTASLNQPAGSAMTVTLSNGAVISIAAGASTGSVSVAAPGEDAVVDAGTVSVTVSATSGGNFETLQVGAGSTATPVVTTITDTTDTTTLSLTASPAVAEGGNITYTASLSNPAGTALTVTLSNGSSIVIAAGSSSASISVAAPTDDVYLDAGSVTASITGTSGGNFESLVNGSVSATTAISDTLDTTTLDLSATPSVSEGGSIVYTASLNQPAGSAMTVTLSNGAVISIAAGASTGSVSVAAPGEDAVVDAGTVSVTVSATSGGNFETLQVGAGSTATPVVTTITDTIDTTTLSLTASPAVAEGGNITYTASLSNPAGTALTVTLSNGSSIVIAAGSSSASISVAAPTDDVYVDAGSVTASITGTSGGNFESLVNGSISATTAISDTLDTTTLDLSATPSVSEGGSIVYTASLNQPAGSAMTVTLSNGAVISIAAGASTGTVTVAAPAEDAVVDAGNVSVTVSGTSGGNFETLQVGAGSTATPVVTTITDTIDTTTLSLTASPAVAEGGNITYTASLSNPAGTALTVTLSNGSSIVIAAGSSSASISVAAPTDDVYLDAGSVTTSITGTTGGNFESLVNGSISATTAISDTLDTTTVTLSVSAASVAEGGSLTYTASVNNPVTGSPLVVTLSNGQIITIPVGQSSASGAAFAVRADDVYTQGTQTLNVGISSATGGNFEAKTLTSTVSTTVTDDADATTVTLSSTTAGQAVTEGGSILYTATVGAPVTGTPLVVTLSNGQSITIPVGQSSASVTYTVRADDAYVQGTQSLSAVSITGTSGAGFEAISTAGTVNNTVTDDADATTVTLSVSAASVAEGGSLTYTASVNNPVTGSPLVVTLSNGQIITIPVGQSSASGAAFAVRADDVYTQGTQTLNVGISSASGGNFEAKTLTSTVSTTVTDDADATTVALSASAASVTEGGSIVYTATINSPVTGSPLVITLNNGQTITIPVGATSANSAAFAVRADNPYIDGTQTLTVGISSATGGNFEAKALTSTVSTSVVDDLDLTTVSLSGATTVMEGASGSYTLTLSSPAVTAVTVNLTYSGVAANGSDFTGVTTVTVPAGASSVNFAIATIDDALFEGAESLSIAITSATGGNFESLGINGSASSVTTTITDNDSAPLVSSISNPTIVEGGELIYTVNLTNASTTATTFAYSLGGGSAAGTDYSTATFSNGVTLSGGVLTVPTGVTSFSVTVPTVQDLLNESTESVPLTIGGVTGTGSITDNDHPPIVTSGTATGVEDTNLVFQWSDFNVTDVDGNAGLAVKIATLPADGVLQYSTNGTTWTSVAANQMILKTEIDLGRLRFVPDANESGADIFGGVGTGNKQADYTSFGYQAYDGQSYSTSIGSMRIDITPTVDGPVVTASSPTGTEGQWITLPVGVALADSDGSEAITAVSLNGLPIGAMLTDGTHTFTATTGSTTANISGWNLSQLQFKQLVTGVSDTFSLTLSATGAETSTGASATASKTFSVTVNDTAPVANADIESVGIGTTATGNVISGLGLAPGGADTLGADAVTITAFDFVGTPVSQSYAAGVWTIGTNNGTLSIDQSGAYSYISKFSNIAVSGPIQATWDAAQINYYGYDRESNVGEANPFVGGVASGGLTISKLDANATALVRFFNNTGTNNDGIGVERTSAAPTDSDSQMEGSEFLVLDLNMATSGIAVTINSLGAGTAATWYAYSSTGAYLGTGVINGTAETAVANISGVTGAQYLVFAGNGDRFRIGGIVAEPDMTGVTPDVFNYTITDADGDVSSTTMTVSTSNQPGAVADVATVYEAGLASGTQIGGTVTTYTGNLLANDTGITGNTQVTAVGGGTPDANGVITVTNAVGTLTVYTTAYSGHQSGDYSYTLTGATTQGTNDVQSFAYTVRNNVSGLTSSSSLTVNVVDDAPVGADVVQNLQAAADLPTYNLMLIVDRSGSMTDVVSGSLTRMDIAKSALAAMIEKYDGIGNINVQIVDFSSTVHKSAWYVDDKYGAKDYIDALNPGGNTYYKDALNTAMSGFTPPPADKTIVYFLSDGEPNPASTQSVTATQRATWENFLQTNDIDLSFAIGVGSGVSLNTMLPISWPNTVDGVSEPYAAVVSNDADLANTLLATVDTGVVIGNVSVLAGSGASGFLLGADGGSLSSVVVDGVTYLRAVSGDTVTIATAKGGSLSVNFVTGEYNYQLSINTTIQGQKEVFPITAVDADGDTKTINLTINLDYMANLDANRDIVLTNVTDGSPLTISADALIHNDTAAGSTVLTGVGGASAGTVTLSGEAVTFDPPPADTSLTGNISVTNEVVNDSQSNALNNTRATAVDLTDRSLFGTVVPGGATFDLVAPDQSGYTQVFKGKLDNVGTNRDVDYVKVQLVAGERLWVDIDSQSQNVDVLVEYQDALGVWQSSAISNNNAYGSFDAPADGIYYLRMRNDSGTTDTSYDLVMTIQSASVDTTFGEFNYTLTDASATDTATAVVSAVTGSTITGTANDEILYGSDNADTLIGNAGKDVLLGNAGTDSLSGGAGADRLEGGSGTDTLDGGADNDILYGGIDNDMLTGGAGSDIFAWTLADKGTTGAPAVDTITDFNTTANSDKLDLRDLLQGETAAGANANLENFLHFEKSGSDTILHISSAGGFSGDMHAVGGAGAFSSGNVDQRVVLAGVDLVGGMSTDQQVIQDLLNKGKLITD